LHGNGREWDCKKQFPHTGLEQDAYDGVGEVVDALFVSDERAVDGVDDERRPADDEHDDDEDERDGDVLLLLVDLALVDRRTVAQVTTVRANLAQHAACTVVPARTDQSQLYSGFYYISRES